MTSSDETREMKRWYAGCKLRSLVSQLVASRALLPLVLACSCLALVPASAAAQTAVDEAKILAREYYERGRALVDQGKLEEAAEAFHRAYELSPHHSVLYSLGNTYAALGRSVKAVDALDRYLREAEAAGKLDKARRSEVDKTLATQRDRIAVITASVKPDGAEITVDGKKIGLSPLAAPIRLDPGEHLIRASHTHYAPGELRITTSGKEARSVELSLAAAAEPSAAGAVTIACPAKGVAVSIDGAAHGTTPLPASIALPAGSHRIRFELVGQPPREAQVNVVAGQTITVPCGLIVIDASRDGADRDQRRTTPGWLTSQRIAGVTIGAVGLAAGLAAIGLYASNGKRYSEYQTEFAALDEIYGRGGPYDASVYQRQSDNDALIRSIQTADKASLGLAIAGGTLLATGVVLVAIGGGKTRSSASWVVQPLARGLLVGAAAEF
jgi:hypothetical protein